MKQQTNFSQWLIAATLIGMGFTACKPKKTMDTTPPEPVAQASEVSLAYSIQAQLGEGAFWNHRSQELFWIDIEAGKLHIFNPVTRQNRTLATGQKVGTVVPVDSLTAMVALEDGVYSLNLQTGEKNRFAKPVSAMPAGHRFNDGKCDPAGRLWVGGIEMSGAKELDFLYRTNSDGTMTPMLDKVTCSNGIVWSADGKTMYYIDTPLRTVRAFDYDVAKGTIANERVVVKFTEEMGFPDGMAIDAEGMLWVAMWGGSQVMRWNPHKSELLQTIAVPAWNVTSCAFGGKNMDTLYITSASIDTPADKADGLPQRGALFKVVPGVKGVESTFFKK